MGARKTAEVKEILERVEDVPKDAAYYQHAIKAAVDDFYYTNYKAETPEEIGKLSQNTFLAACVHARKQCIERDALLKFIPQQINKYSVVHNEVYDKDKVEALCTAYLELCYLYDKIPSIYGFSELSGIDRGILHDWINTAKGVTSRRSDHTPKKAILKLKDARGEMLQNSAISGGRGVVGSIAVLNNTVWKNEEVEQEERPVLSVYDLPTLDDLRHMSEIEEKPRQLLPQFDPETGKVLKEPGVHTP